MARRVQRWTEVTPSQFPHEAEGLAAVRRLLPDTTPFRAWSNFEFRDRHGKWHEVDLLVLGRRQMHLVELKYYAGTVRGDDLTWRRDGHRAEDSPLKLARRKAQRLASRLADELIRWAQETGAAVPDVRAVVPFVQESVFLHHPDGRCELPARSRTDLFGLDGKEARSGLPGISGRLLEPPTPRQDIGPNRENILVDLMARIGVVQRRQREAGSWVIDEEPLGEGDGWQDWPAFHRVATTDRARIRFLVTPPGAPATARARVRQVAEHEFRVMSRLANDSLLRPRDLVDSDLGIGVVYPLDERYQRLDLWLADQGDRLTVKEQLAVLRLVAEAVSYAHRNRVVHRALSPHAVSVRALPGGGTRVLVGDWQSAGAVAAGLSSLQGSGPGGTSGPSGQSAPGGVTGLLGVTDGAQATAAPGLAAYAGLAGADRRAAEVFQAPEGVWNPSADRVRLDVFALGALAYYLLAGRAPAPDRAALRDRLQRDGGLDLAAGLPQAPRGLRELVLSATCPAVSGRLPDVRSFLRALDDAQRDLAGQPEDVADPLEATPGAVIDGRFRLERRLGEGSTAVGLLVTDLTAGDSGPGALRVLKVARDDAAAGRLAGEAGVLAGLSGPRLVRLAGGPVRVGGRQALLLEPAGDETLAEVLRGRERLSLDLLERWGADLLEALAALDKAGVSHRDIKPANLGVRENRGDRARHLVLFDFSLSRAGATAVTAGTPPYLDPFLDDPERGRYDSAAERYAVAVVLFEMATGSAPRFGDGLSDPGSVPDEAAVEHGMFDPAVAGALAAFFRRSLARRARQRHHTAAEMLADWRKAFAPVPGAGARDGGELADRAGLSTPLAGAGLSARALSALEPYGVATVGDLLAIDPVRLNRLAGVAEATRREVKGRARKWRERLAGSAAGRPSAGQVTQSGDRTRLPDPVSAARLLSGRAGTARAASRRMLAALLLGLEPGLDAFASRAELRGRLNVTRARVSQQMGTLQDGWASDPACAGLLDAVAGVARQALADAGGVATVDELAGSVRAALPPAALPPADRPPAAPSPSSRPAVAGDTGDVSPGRVCAGLLRLALDRARDLSRAGAGGDALAVRRRDGRVAILAADPALLDPAEAVAAAADGLVSRALAAGEPVIPASRAAGPLRDAWDRALASSEQPSTVSAATTVLDDGRLLLLAAALARSAALSGAGELYHRDLPVARALALALAGVGAGLPVSPREVRDRLRARFPALPPPPERPRLDLLIAEAGLGLVYDDAKGGYRSPARGAETASLSSRQATAVAAGPQLVAGGRTGHRLAESVSARSFLALGVDAARPDRADRAVGVLAGRFGVDVVDVTRVLVDSMREQAAAAGLPWDMVTAADAAAPGSRDAEGLTALVRRSLPAVEQAVETALAAALPGAQPVLLTEIAPLARYGHLAVIARWSDLGLARRQAVWVLVPQLPGSQGPVIDRRPLPLAAPGQFFRMDNDWIDTHAAAPAAGGAP